MPFFYHPPSWIVPKIAWVGGHLVMVLRKGFLHSTLFIYFFIVSFAPGKQSESIVYGNIQGCGGHCFCWGSAACSYERRDFSICFSPNRQINGGIYNTYEILITTAFGGLFLGWSPFVMDQNNIPKPLVLLQMTGSLTCSFSGLRRKRFKQRILYQSYYSNSHAGLWSSVFRLVAIFIHYRVPKIVARFQTTLEISKIDTSLKLVVTWVPNV